MMKHLILLSLLLPLQANGQPLLTQPDMRITDAAIESDLQQFRALQKRLDAYAIPDDAFSLYQHSKAQALLDMSWDEYHENDRTGVVEESISLAATLIEALENSSAAGMETPLISGTRISRQPLWDEAQALKQHQGFKCAQKPVAELEIYLLWAGHQLDELGWRHAKDQTDSADERLQQAKSLADACKKPSKTHKTMVYFDLNKHDLKATGPGTLDAALQFVRQYPDAYQIRIEAHTDHLNSETFNQKLSEKRAKTVKQYFIEHGLDEAIITTAGFGESREVFACDEKVYTTHDKMAACLQPNRRAEIFISTPEVK